MINCPECGELQKPGKKCRNKECGADISKVKSPTHGLRFHDLRHHAITELSEGQASDQTIMSIAGHVSLKMLAHYSHVRLDAKRKALDALSGGSSGSGYGTNHDTIAPVAPEPSPQVVEINGRPGRTRTSDLFRVKEVTGYWHTQNQQVTCAVAGNRWLRWAVLACFCSTICSTGRPRFFLFPPRPAPQR